jgi:hypothetical protein
VNAKSAYLREWRARNPERAKAHQLKYRTENRDKVRASNRASQHRRRNGPGRAEWIAEREAAQGGRCYLCGEPPPQGRFVIDHDHSCCAKPNSCSACRRGLACHRCNLLIGQVGDDPALLRRIADALEAALVPAKARIAAKPSQLTLDVQAARVRQLVQAGSNGHDPQTTT